MTVFMFEPGQDCFNPADHTLYLVRGGDRRAQTAPAKLHTRPSLWVQEFQDNQGRLSDLIQEG